MHVAIPFLCGALCVPAVFAKGVELSRVIVVIIVSSSSSSVGYGRRSGKLTEFIENAQFRCVVEECGDEIWWEGDLKGVLRDYFAAMVVVIYSARSITPEDRCDYILLLSRRHNGYDKISD